MIIDVFPFFNEYELLKLRVEMLKGVVDLHLAVAATHTYQGDKIHPLMPDWFEEWLDAEKWKSQPPIGFEWVDTGGEFSSPWEREKFQRQQIRDVVASTQLSDDDIIIYTDADELPNPEAVRRYVHVNLDDTYALQMRTFYYGTQLEDPLPTDRAKIFRWGQEKDGDWNDLRWESPRFGSSLPKIPSAGWHISYYGGPDRIKTKLQSFSHTEYSSDRHIRRIQSGVSTRLGPNNERLVAVEQATLPDLLRGL